MILARMGAYPGSKSYMFVQKLLQYSLEMWYMGMGMGAYLGVGACSGHYGNAHAHAHVSKICEIHPST